VLSTARLAASYEKAARSFSELLPWMTLVAPDLVLQKDGSLLAIYRYDGVDQEGLEPVEIDRYAELIEHALRNFDERITLWWTVDRRRTTDYPDGEFSSVVGRRIDQAWRESLTHGNQYTNTYHLALLCTPAGGTEGFMDKVSHFTRQGSYGTGRALAEALRAQFLTRNAFVYSAAQLDAQMRAFGELLRAFEETLSDLGLDRLADTRLLAFLHDRCSPASEGQPVRMPRVPNYLDGYLHDCALAVDADTLRFHGNETAHVAALSVKDWPESTYPGVFDQLLAVEGEVTVSQVFRFVQPDQARRYIQDVERHNRNLQKSLRTYLVEAFTHEASAMRDEGRVLLAEDAAAALTELTAVNRAFGYYNLTVLAYGPSREAAECTAKEAAKWLRRAGFLVVRETLHLLSAWSGTLPGQWGMLVRWFFVSGANLADLSPARTLWTGRRENQHLHEQTGRPCPALTVLPTDYRTPYWFNFHVGDLGHTLVVGPSGMGKSVFVNFLLAQFRKYAPCNVIIFDKDYSCRVPTLLQGGAHIDLTGERGGQVRLNPLALIGEREAWVWLTRWLEILLSSRGYAMRADDDRALWQALESVAEQPRGNWMLRTLYPFLPKALGEQLVPWIGDGQLARFFDNEADSFELSDFTCVEMGGCSTTRESPRPSSTMPSTASTACWTDGPA
jgi:type IV secretion system protein VirB4